jgi:hypothetical protein
MRVAIEHTDSPHAAKLGSSTYAVVEPMETLPPAHLHAYTYAYAYACFTVTTVQAATNHVTVRQ